MAENNSLVKVAVIAAVPGTIAALVSAGALGMSIYNAGKIEEVHKATNSMKDELVKVTRSDALQEGHTDGVADQKAKVASERDAVDAAGKSGIGP